MFDKIANIGILKDNSGRNPYTSFEKTGKRKARQEKSVGDSISFSPAAIFLAEVKWGLSGVDYSSNSLVKFDFYIGAINFKLQIDFNDFYKTSHQDVWVSKEVLKHGKKKKYVTKLLIKKPKIRLFEKFAPFNIPGIQNFFARIEKLNVGSEFYKYESMALISLIDGMTDQIYEEFTKIFFVIYSFIDKLDKYDINHMYVFPETSLDRIVVEKVFAQNG
jgi:hypothetical protein